jgi:hypothetical protein
MLRKARIAIASLVLETAGRSLVFGAGDVRPVRDSFFAFRAHWTLLPITSAGNVQRKTSARILPMA